MHNDISGGVFFNTVVQGQNVTLQLPRELPPHLTGMPDPSPAFTGRGADLAFLKDVLRPRPPGDGAPRVCSVAGLPGVGKTELVRQAAWYAWREQDWFPGGVLFIDLFGYDAERRLTPERALGSLLRALGVTDEHLPADLQDRARLYRSVLAAYADQGRRLLVVLDNAGSSDQARPLLSGDPRIPVLVTSRHTLTGLGARLYDLSVLDETAAVDLLAGAVRQARGEDDTRVADDPGAAARLARLCGHLPLALRIVAALLAELPSRPLASMAGALEDGRSRLERLTSEDATVRAAFALSYAHLRPDQARLFRLLSLNPGPDLSTEAAARLADTDPHAAEELLRALARGHLLEAGATYGRWRMHDLMRLYAAELGEAHGTEDAAARALERLLQHYVTTARAAAGHLAHDSEPHPLFPTRNQALTWLDDERINLIAVATTAGALGASPVPLMLFESLGEYFSLRRHFDDWLGLGAVAMSAARAMEWPLALAGVLNNISVPMRHLRRFEEAVSLIELAADLYRQIDDRSGEAGALSNLGLVLGETRRFDEAITVLEKAIAIHRETGELRSEGIALTNLGLVLQDLRRFPEAIEVHRRDAAICARIGDRRGEALALNNLGAVLRHEGLLDEAAEALIRAQGILHELGDVHGEAQTLTNLGLVRSRQGRSEESLDAQRRAVEAFRACHAPHSEANALGNLGLSLIRAGRNEEALAPLEEAVVRYRELADRNAEGRILVNLASALAGAGRPADALTACTGAVACYRDTDDRYHEGLARVNLAQVLQETGDPAGSAAALAEGVRALRETGVLEQDGPAPQTLEDVHKMLEARGIVD
ncbi:MULTISPECIES: tetratricopeptide repeat protein [Streptomyces]|uniref:AfsR-like transcriptional regulator TcrA n=1 Tax=Streptomyces luteosporeus TaxID=173856 RepID=A0ABP6FZW8_9ACTN